MGFPNRNYCLASVCLTNKPTLGQTNRPPSSDSISWKVLLFTKCCKNRVNRNGLSKSFCSSYDQVTLKCKSRCTNSWRPVGGCGFVLHKLSLKKFQTQQLLVHLCSLFFFIKIQLKMHYHLLNFRNFLWEVVLG